MLKLIGSVPDPRLDEALTALKDFPIGFVASDAFPISACVLLSLIAAFAFFRASFSLEYRSMLKYLTDISNAFESKQPKDENQSNKVAKALSEVLEDKDILKYSQFSLFTSSLVTYYNHLLHAGNEGKFEATESAAKSLTFDIGYDDGLSRTADQIARLALFFTFIGIAFGLSQATGIFAEAGGNEDEIINGIKNLFKTATNKFFISAVGLLIAVILKWIDASRRQKIEIKKAELFKNLDAAFLSKRNLSSPELEAARHVIHEMGKGFSTVTEAFAGITNELSEITNQVKIWSEIATKITGEQRHQALGVEMQAFVTETMSALDQIFTDQYRKTDLIFEEQIKAAKVASDTNAAIAASLGVNPRKKLLKLRKR